MSGFVKAVKLSFQGEDVALAVLGLLVLASLWVVGS